MPARPAASEGRPLRRRRRWWPAAILAAVAYAWAVAWLRPFTVPMELAVAVPELGVAAAAWRAAHRAGRRPAPPVSWSPALGWVALLVVLGAWEVAAYLGAPRSAHPTLSSLAGAAMRWHAARAGLIALWLVGGWDVLAGRRPARPPTGPGVR